MIHNFAANPKSECVSDYHPLTEVPVGNYVGDSQVVRRHSRSPPLSDRRPHLSERPTLSRTNQEVTPAFMCDLDPTVGWHYLLVAKMP